MKLELELNIYVEPGELAEPIPIEVKTVYVHRPYYKKGSLHSNRPLTLEECDLSNTQQSLSWLVEQRESPEINARIDKVVAAINARLVEQGAAPMASDIIPKWREDIAASRQRIKDSQARTAQQKTIAPSGESPASTV